ncbi:hypothetical protein F2Q70_00024711 [Brassica cretica]|uniref:ALG11 mannosyltransferase N-terminal domain-containing protein n=1 Tax=Brassica cretica TaxID=69181 RepID=A0A8S9L7H1_BRACR|nr:hypothetical protein F2Q70_00024711 [Brassica cretica]
MAICFILYAFLTLLSALSLTLSLSIINARKSRKRAVGFFHPYTNDGGGGERVLWCAVKAIQEETPDLDCIVFTGDHDSSSDSLSRRAVIHLNNRRWIEERTYPHFTMIGQSLGSVYLAWEALRKFTPLYFIDTSGYAFTYPLARLFGCKVVCYTHYPTISLDMISRVRQRNSMYNNDASIAKSNWLSTCKVVYYRAFSWLYGMVGSCTHLAMVNSSWTKSHIEVLWRIPEQIRRVYPPCDTSGLEEYAEAIVEVVKMSETERLKMAEYARKRARRFSEQQFSEDFKTAIRPVFTCAVK